MYSVEADLNLSDQRLIELTESEGNVGAKNTALLARLQSRAYNRINSALTGKYVVPVHPAPAILTEIEADLWKFYLYEHREVMDIPASVQGNYDRSTKMLESYRKGEEMLDAPRSLAATGPASSGGSFNSDDTAVDGVDGQRVFGRVRDGLF